MKKLKSQKVYFKGFDEKGNERFSWLGEESHFNENGDVLLHRKFDESGVVFEEGENTYSGEKLIKEVYDCRDEGTSMVTTYQYDDQGRDLEVRIDYENYSEIRKFDHGPEFTSIRFEDEDGVLEKLNKVWYDSAARIIKSEVYDEDELLSEIQEFAYTDKGDVLTEKLTDCESDTWSLQTYSYDERGNQIACHYTNESVSDELVFEREFDDKDRMVKVVHPGQQEVLFEYDGDTLTQNVYDLGQGRRLAAITKFYKQDDHPVKTVSTHNVRSHIIDSMAIMKSGVVRYEYHFENEFYQ